MVSGQRDLAREPCPDRIVEDLGGAFGMGCVGGFLWHFGKGWYNSPKGEKFLGALYSSRMRAPILGGNFAVWGGTFSSFDCTFQYIRKKDDCWNAIASGAATGGLLALRGGWRSASKQAAIGAVLLAVIESVMVIFSRKAGSTPRDQYYQAMEMEKKMQKTQVNPSVSSPATSWFSPGISLASASTSSDSQFDNNTHNNSSGLLSGSSMDLSDGIGSSFGNSSTLQPAGFSPFSSEYSPASSAGESVAKKRWRWFA